jgi:hypothetical protein
MMQPHSRAVVKTPAPTLALAIAPARGITGQPHSNETAFGVQQASPVCAAGHDLSQVPASLPASVRDVSSLGRRIQRKPVVGTADDAFEREADDVADKVMRMVDPVAVGTTPVAIQRKCARCEDEDKSAIQAKREPGAHLDANLDAGAAVRAASQGGVPLSTELRTFFEPRFGHDFSGVRVHANAAAADGARAVQARAYAYGQDIVFGAGEYVPGTMQGRRLLAHELAHVVQQRESASCCTVQRAPADWSAPAAQLPLADATRMFNPGVEYWLEHAPDLSRMKAHELLDEIHQIDEWLRRQISNSQKAERLRHVRDQMQAAVTILARKAYAKPEKAKVKTRREHAAPTRRPRLLRERQSLQTSDPAILAVEYDDIVDALQSNQLSKGDRLTLQTELINLSPAMGEELAHRAERRQAQAVVKALIPGKPNGGAVDTLDIARRVDSVRPLAGHPGQNYLTNGGEMLIISDTQLKAIRASVISGLAKESAQIHDRTEEIQGDLHEFVTRTYDEHTYIGFLSIVGSGENPLDWGETIMPHVQASNNACQRFAELARRANDPSSSGLAPLEPMALAIYKADVSADGARYAFGSRQDRMFEATNSQIKVLRTTKFVGQLASNVALTPAGAALYSAVEDSAVQGVEIYYGQRDHFDATSVLIDAGTSYIGGKVNAGVMKLAGKEASLLRKGAVFLVADRSGATAATTLWMGANSLAGRTDFSLGDVYHAGQGELLNLKGAAENVVIGKATHAAVRGLTPRGPRIPHGSRLGQTVAPDGPAMTAIEIVTPDATVRPQAAPATATIAQPAHTASSSTHKLPQLPVQAVPLERVQPAEAPTPTAKTTGHDPALAEWAKNKAPGDRSMTREQWKAQHRKRRLNASIGASIDRAFEKLEHADKSGGVEVPKVTGGKSDPRIDDTAVPGPRRLPGNEQQKVKPDGNLEDPRERILDMQHVSRHEGETGRQALARVRSLIGHRLSEFPALEALWNDAKQSVLSRSSLTADNKGELYERTRKAFWRRVRGNTPEGERARALLETAGFRLPKRKTRAAQLVVEGDVFKEDLTMSLDHVEEKGHGDGWRKALDADNLSMEFAAPNSEREIKQMRHSDLRTAAAAVTAAPAPANVEAAPHSGPPVGAPEAPAPLNSVWVQLVDGRPREYAPSEVQGNLAYGADVQTPEGAGKVVGRGLPPSSSDVEHPNVQPGGAPRLAASPAAHASPELVDEMRRLPAEEQHRLLARVARGDAKGRRFGTPRNPRMPTIEEFNPRMASVRAGDLEASVSFDKHGINPDQERSIGTLSSEDLTRFRLEDPISGSARNRKLSLTGGHHRSAEIINRVKAGNLSPDTIVKILVHD